MAAEEIRKDDVGTVFKLEIKDQDGAVVNVSGTSVPKDIIFRKPNGTILTKTASYTTDGSDGFIQYTTGSGDLTPVGNWEYQGFVSINAGSWKTDIKNFKLYKNLE